MEEYDTDTGRTYLNAAFMESYRDDPLYQGLDGVDWNDRANCRYLGFLVTGAEDYDEYRPSLLLNSMEKWQANVAGGYARQREIRCAGIQAVVLRAIHENTSNVLMSERSLAKAIEVITGRRPGKTAITRLYQWFGSSESPFKIVRRGQRGNHLKSTMIKVTVEAGIWDQATTEVELKRTAEWLSTQDHVLGELYADEANRKADRPALKAYWAMAMDTKARNAAKKEQDLLESGAGTSSTRQAKAIPLSGIKKYRWIKIQDSTEPKGYRWEREYLTPLVPTVFSDPPLAPDQPTWDYSHLLECLGEVVETEQERFARLFPTLVDVPERQSTELDLSRWAPSADARERQERRNRISEHDWRPWNHRPLAGLVL